MKLRLALPILSVSAGIMLTGLSLSLVHAQEPDEEEEQEGEEEQPAGDEEEADQEGDEADQEGDEADARQKALEARRKALQKARERARARREAQKQKNQDDDEDQPPRGRKQQAPAKRLPAPPAPPGQQAGPAAGAEDLKPFETGIDFKPKSPRTRVTFNLEDADLPDLVRLISQITGRRFILPTKLRNVKATVFAPTQVTAAEAYQAFLSILELNGLTVVPAGRYLKIVESSGIESRPISLYAPDSRVPSGDRYVTHLYRVRHVASADLTQLLERFKSGDGSITAYEPTNTLIITDTGTNMRRMKRILNMVDVPRTGERIWVEPVHYANASEIAERLVDIFEPQGSAPTTSRRKATKKRRRAKRKRRSKRAAQGAATIGEGTVTFTRIIADERTNSLIIMATEHAYLRILEMLRYLDVPMEGEGKIHVHHLQHSDASEISKTLSDVVGAQRGRTKGQKRGQAVTGSTFEGQINITAHESSNALVITSSPHDYAALRTTIDKLDVRRRQVFIEAVIMEMSVNRSSELGLGFHGGVPDFPADDSVMVLGSGAEKSVGGLEALALNPDALSGLAVGVEGPEVENSSQLGFSLPSFGVALTALANSGDANVLSTPHLIAMDNVEAEINIGQNVPLQTSTTGSFGGLGSLAGLAGGLSGGGQQQGGTSGLAGLASLGGLGTVPRQDVGITITLTPHINDSDEIRLEIAEEISDAGAPSESGNLGVVSIQRTRARTELVVGDQQTVVIGGLMRDTVRNSETKVPILGDIPVLGALFRSTSKQKQKRNLLLFLTPYIVRSPQDLRSIYERKMRERQEFLDRYFVFGDHEYSPPIDYSRTRGLIGEIFVELERLAEQRTLLEAASTRDPTDHQPRPPVGDAPPPTAGEGLDEEIIGDEEGGGDEPAGGDAPEPPEPPPGAQEPAPEAEDEE